MRKRHAKRFATAMMFLGFVVWIADDVTIDTDWLGASGLVVALGSAWVIHRITKGYWW